MIVVSMPKRSGRFGQLAAFGQLTPEEVEAELSRRGVYRAEEGVPVVPAAEVPEAPAEQIIVVPEGGAPVYYEPYLPVIPRGEEPTGEEWQQYAPVAPPEAEEKKPISKTALIIGGVILGGLLLFGGRAAAGARPAPTVRPAPARPAPTRPARTATPARVTRRVTEEFAPAEAAAAAAEEGEYEF